MSEQECVEMRGEEWEGEGSALSLALEEDQCWSWKAVCTPAWPPNLLLRWLHQRKMPYLWWFTQIMKSLNLLGFFFCLSCTAFDVAASPCRCNNSLVRGRVWVSQLWFASAGRHDSRVTWKPTQGMQNTFRPAQEARYLQLSAPWCSLEVHGTAEKHKLLAAIQLIKMSLASSLPHFSFYLTANNFHSTIWHCWVLHIKPVSIFKSSHNQGKLLQLRELLPAKSWTIGSSTAGRDLVQTPQWAKLLRHLYIFYVKFLSVRSPLGVGLCSGGFRD